MSKLIKAKIISKFMERVSFFSSMKIYSELCKEYAKVLFPEPSQFEVSLYRKTERGPFPKIPKDIRFVILVEFWERYYKNERGLYDKLACKYGTSSKTIYDISKGH